jgi:hypothetical protein
LCNRFFSSLQTAPPIRSGGRFRGRHGPFDCPRYRERGDMGGQVSGQRSRHDQDPLQATWRWHFVDIELSQPDLASACVGHLVLPPGVPASKGPPQACVGRQDQAIRVRARRSGSNASEQLLALKFLLHLVGDLHQPRHGRPRRGREQEVRFGRRTAPEQPSSLLGCRVRGAAGDRPATSCGRLDRGDVGTATARVVERNISRLGDRSLLTCSTRRVRPATTTRRSRRISASASVHGASCAGCRTST